jgi:hypothetical protein
MKNILPAILVLSFQIAYAQNRDSLLQLANTNKADTNTVKALRALAGISNAAKTREAIAFGFKGSAMSKELNWHKGTAGLLFKYQLPV